MQQLITDIRSAMAQRVQSATARDLLSMAGRLVDESKETIEVPQRRLFVLKPQWEILSDDVVLEVQTGLQYFRDDVPGGKRNWEDSMAAARALDVGGYRDWRPTNKIELLWMMSATRCKPAYDTTIFRGNPDAWLWCDENYAPGSGCAWGVYSGGGDADGGGRDGRGLVRAARGGQF